MYTAEYWIQHLKLKPHPEGGFYNEVFRSNIKVPKEVLPFGYKSDHRVATSIYFLLRSNDISKMHRLRSDELWYFHSGSSAKIIVIDHEGHKHTILLGSNHQKAEQLFAHIPAGNVFAAEVANPDSYCLMSCVVAPGFEFEDFEMFSKEDLIQAYPKYADLFEKYC